MQQLSKEAKKEEKGMRLQSYLDKLFWSQSELARKTGLSLPVIKRALDGETITRASALKIISAIQEGMKPEEVTARDITGLKVEGVTVRKRDTRRKTRKEQ